MRKLLLILVMLVSIGCQNKEEDIFDMQVQPALAGEAYWEDFIEKMKIMDEKEMELRETEDWEGIRNLLLAALPIIRQGEYSCPGREVFFQDSQEVVKEHIKTMEMMIKIDKKSAEIEEKMKELDL